MEKKKLKLSISGTSKKTLNSIEEAKSKSKNSVVIEKKNSKFHIKSQYPRQNNESFRPNRNTSQSNIFSKPSTQPSSDFEKRKLAEQRATRRLKADTSALDAVGKKTVSVAKMMKGAFKDLNTALASRGVEQLAGASLTKAPLAKESSPDSPETTIDERENQTWPIMRTTVGFISISE